MFEGFELSEKQIALFWSKVEKNKSCWLWKGGKKNRGYGQFYINRKPYYAHRISYYLSRKIDPGPLNILHSCDNPACVNPSHLFIGTQMDNIRDCKKKGRLNCSFGENHYCTHLKNVDVLYIRELHKLGVRTGLIARIFKIGRRAALDIIKRKTWKHL